MTIINNLISGGGGVTSDEVTSTTSQVLSGYTALTNDSNDEVASGTMVDNGNWIANILAGDSIAVPQGYHNGQGYVNAIPVSYTIEYFSISLGASYYTWQDIEKNLYDIFGKDPVWITQIGYDVVNANPSYQYSATGHMYLMYTDGSTAELGYNSWTVPASTTHNHRAGTSVYNWTIPTSKVIFNYVDGDSLSFQNICIAGYRFRRPS